jgi:hypothetical protein
MAKDKINEATTVASSRSREENIFHTIKIHIKGGCVVEVDNLPELFDYEIIDHDVSEE